MTSHPTIQAGTDAIAVTAQVVRDYGPDSQEAQEAADAVVTTVNRAIAAGVTPADVRNA
jgi:hypothetical protein